MKKLLLLFIISYFIQFHVAYCQGGVDFKNKYFIYSTESKTEMSFFADFFYANNEDTIMFIESYFGYRYNLGVPVYALFDSNSNNDKDLIPGTTNRPYTVTIHKKNVFFTFFYDDTLLRNETGDSIATILQYKLNKNDTFIAERDNKKNKQFIVSERTIYLGDTAIMFYNNKIECYKFIEYSAFKSYGGPKEVFEKYLEKKTFVPVKINRCLLFDDGRVTKDVFVLRMILDKSEVISKEYRSPYYR